LGAIAVPRLPHVSALLGLPAPIDIDELVGARCGRPTTAAVAGRHRATDRNGASSVAFGVWGTTEVGTVSGRSTSDSPNGAFRSSGVILGIDLGGRQYR
jgi:hypothetical protein